MCRDPLIINDILRESYGLFPPFITLTPPPQTHTRSFIPYEAWPVWTIYNSLPSTRTMQNTFQSLRTQCPKGKRELKRENSYTWRQFLVQIHYTGIHQRDKEITISFSRNLVPVRRTIQSTLHT